MKGRIKYLIGIIILTAMMIGFSLPVCASFIKIPGKIIESIELARKGKGEDPPWDPGDESASLKDPRNIEIFNANFIFGQLIPGDPDLGNILAKSKADDPPWDPGDEFDPGEVENA